MAPLSKPLTSIFKNGPALGLTIAGTMLLKNDQRDTVDTAAIVAPLAYGGTYLFNSMSRKAASGVSNIFKATTTSNNPIQTALVQNANYNQMKAVFRDRGASKNVFDATLSGYMSKMNKRTRNLDQELTSVTKMLQGNFVYDDRLKDLVQRFLDNPGAAIPKQSTTVSKKQISLMRQARNIARNYTERRKLVANAFVGAVYDSSSPADLLRMHEAKRIFPKTYFGPTTHSKTHIAHLAHLLDPHYLSQVGEQSVTGSMTGNLEDLPIPAFNDVLNRLHSTLSNRPEFNKSLKARLTKALHLKDPLGQSTYYNPNGAQGEGFITPDPDALTYHSLNDPTIANRVPDYENLKSNLNSAMARRRIQNAQIVSERVVRGETIGTELLGVKIVTGDYYSPTSTGTDFFIPFKNPNGNSRGLNRNSYVVRDVINDAGKTIPLTTFASDILARRADISDEALRKDAEAFAYWHGAESRLNASEEGSLEFNLFDSDQSARLRSQAASFSSLPVYTRRTGKNAGELTDFLHLSAAERKDKIMQLVLRGEYLPLGSENNMNAGTLENAILEKLHPFWLHSMEKQEHTYRALTKDVKLVPLNGESSAFGNEAYEELLGMKTVPEAAINIANIAPQDKSFLHSLPRSWEEFQAQEEDIKARSGISDSKWSGFRSALEKNYAEGGHDALDAFGRLGETEYMLDPDFAKNYNVVSSPQYEMDESVVSPGQEIKAGEVVGFNQTAPVVANADGVVSSVSDANKGMFRVNIDQKFTLDGAKVDVNGVKGQGFVTNAVQRMRNLANSLYEARGTGDYIPEGINAIADMSYNINKAHFADTHLSLLSQVLSNAYSGDDYGAFEGLDAVAKNPNSKLSWEDEFNPSILQHYSFDGKKVTLKTGQLNSIRAQRRQQIEEVVELGNQVLEKANERVREKIAQGYEFKNPFFAAFAKSGSSDLTAWALKNNQLANLRVWDHGALNVAKTASLTFDMDTFAAMSGHYGAIKTLKERREMYGGGSIEQTERFVKHLVDPTSNPLSNVVSVDKAFPNRKASLTTPEGRMNSIFDDSLEQYKDNFSLDLGEGGKHRYVPVLGTGAYQGTTPKVTEETVQAREFQRKIKAIAGEKDIEKRDHMVDELHSLYFDNLASGKGSVLRPYSYDPHGVTGFLRTKTTTDPFDVFIGREVLDKVKDSKTKAALLAGEHSYGMLWRQPISEAMHVRVKYDPTLTGGHGIAASEKLYRLYQADDDKDPVSISMWQKGTDAYTEAHEALTTGSQKRNLESFYEIMGKKEDSMSISADLKSIGDMFTKYWKPATNIEKTIQDRTARSTIGLFSNELSNIMEAAASNTDIVRDQEKASRLKHMLFTIRQTPITKARPDQNYDVQAAMADVKKLATSFGNEDEDAAFDVFHSTMKSLAGLGKDPNEANPLLETLESDTGKQDIRDLLRSRTAVSRTRANILMGRGDAKDLLAALKTTGLETVGGSIHGFATLDVANQLGSINSAYREAGNAGKATRDAFKDATRIFTENHGKAALIGLGAIAALGLLGSGSNRKSISMSKTSNQFRPEETAGVADRLPGAPIIGSQSSNPPRQMAQTPHGVATAIVAPLNNSVSTDIRLRAKDNYDSLELSKSMAKLAGKGHQHVNVNYSTDPRIGTLRFRDHVRSMRDN